MRIVGGKSRGLKLAGFDVKGIRPTTDRIREALFNILAHDADLRSDAGPFPAGARVLDVFAGTGAMGLEALSRGAAHVAFIENGPEVLKLLDANIERSRAVAATEIVRRDATTPGRARRAFDLVLMDPPYGQGLHATALRALDEGGWLADSALTIVETDRRDAFDLPAGFEQTGQRDYGRTRLAFLRRVQNPD
ncbi:16S rRNA (guanine(966)-N(2))-methyltransferase RsmD [Minwuia sp.]|uniref:16S rRNA (guanine(966)-N(2))-methyltransferase RsmD n=1 Tax=Minwuia sp. TaxID=2493630 RepID=UPI003A9316ED